MRSPSSLTPDDPGGAGAGGDPGSEATVTADGSGADMGVPHASQTGDSALPPRYEDVRRLGSGGFGEVRRVLDRKLGRCVAMKMLHARDDPTGSIRARFIAEATLTASLQHPGIVAIHDFGELPDGRLWYTMPEVLGRTFRSILEEASAGPSAKGPRWSRRRLLDVCARTAETMGYAHSHGVIHRDLKPENIMIGEFGQVMIMDWGLARRVVSEPPPDSGSSAGQPSSGAHGQDASLTQQGDILGTPAYMSPEQARGNVHLHGPTSDVYSLGAILFHILAGHPPFADLGPMAWRRILTGDPPRLSEVAKPDVPGELLAICERAMAFEPGKRFSDGAEMAVEINAFLDGAHRRERALAELGTATLLKPEIDRRKALAGTLRAKAREVLSKARPADPVEVKLPGWELEDEAEKNDHEAELLETNWLQGVLGALSIDPELPEAHSGLADHYKEKLLDAEQQRRTGEAARFEVLLRAHDRGQHAAILSGKGALSLHTDPEGAEVTLYRYSVVKRRLVPELVKELGRTPLSEVSLDKGSYLVRIQAPGRIDVSYPVLIERGRCWDGCPPGSDEPCPVALPELSEVGDDEVYVPAGPAWTGGDPDAVDNLPRRLVWMSGFFVGRYPVTNGEYLAFLNDLVATGREEEAWAACPKSDRGVGGGAGGELSYARGPLGAFLCKEQDSGMPWSVRSPVVLVSWRSAMAYAKWRSARSGRRYRLLNELEREKATRGVDGRPFPWGSSFDATWARSLMSQTGAPSPVEVTEYATDESPYGLRGGAGNVRDLCGNRWTLDGPRVEQGRLLVEEEPAESSVEYVSSRGGAWQSVEHLCRAAGRYAISPDQWRTTLGFRVGRSLGEPVRR